MYAVEARYGNRAVTNGLVRKAMVVVVVGGGGACLKRAMGEGGSWEWDAWACQTPVNGRRMARVHSEQVGTGVHALPNAV